MTLDDIIYNLENRYTNIDDYLRAAIAYFTKEKPDFLMMDQLDTICKLLGDNFDDPIPDGWIGIGVMLVPLDATGRYRWSLTNDGYDNGKYMSKAGAYILHPYSSGHPTWKSFAHTPAAALVAACLKTHFHKVGE